MKTNFDPQDFDLLLSNISIMVDCLARSQNHKDLCNGRHAPELNLTNALRILQQVKEVSEYMCSRKPQIEAKNWAKELLEADNWAILDTETTGDRYEPEVCQIAVITPDMPDGWQTYVQPTVPISSEASQIHGITDNDVKEAPTFDQAFLHLMRKIKHKDVVIYNADFDLKAIKKSLRAHGIQLAFPTSDRRKCRIFSNGGSIHDAMLWYSQWIGDWNDYHGNYQWQVLPGGDHSALGDCKATLEVIRTMSQYEMR